MSAYRVAGLPRTVSHDDAQSILDEFFGKEAETKIRSLGLHPQRPSVVAIVMFSSVPACLSGTSPWRLERALPYDGHTRHIRLEIDTAFLGFTPLNIVDGNDGRTMDCIVVGGLSGHPFGSWKERGGQFMWLVDDRDAYPASVRMLLYGYDTTLVASRSFQDISDIGERLAVSVRSVRKPPHRSMTAMGLETEPQPEPEPAPRPIVFIAHSLGGLVVKEAVCQMASKDQLNARCVYGLVFFGVPHQGLLVEPWLRVVDKRANVALVESLRPGSRILQRLDDRFRAAFALPGSKVVSVYETMESNTTAEKSPGVWDRSGESRVLVDISSAIGHWPDCVSHTQIPVNQTHEDLPKFRGGFDQDYLLLMDYLRDIWGSAITAVRSRVATTAWTERKENGSGTMSAAAEPPPTPSSLPPPPVGLLPLWPDPEKHDVRKFETEVDVIAIHGLGGHALDTWTEGGKLWLYDFLPHEPPKVRVLTFGYNADDAFTGASAGTLGSVSSVAHRLLDDIVQLRRRYGDEPGRKIIFVCHDLGGIVFKQALVLAQENKRRYSDIGDSITGVVFLGTPHRGPDTAFWTDYFAKMARVHQLPSSSPAELGARSAELGNACCQFVERGMRLQIFSLYEKQFSEPLNSLVVDEFSALLHLPNETPIHLDADHNGMSRFLTSSSANYLAVYNCIFELIDMPSRTSERTYFNRPQREFLSRLGAVDEKKVLDLIPFHWGQSSRWLLENVDFASWTELRGRQVLWLHGPPGSGKTVLMRTVVTHLVEQSDQGEASSADSFIVRKPLHFFFDDKDLTRKTTVAFVRSVLSQILCDSRTAFVIKYLEGRDHVQDAASEESLWKCLATIIQRSRGIVFQLVVDAVDEVLRSASSAVSALSIVDRLEQLTALDSSGRLTIMLSHREKPTYEFPGADVTAINVNNSFTQASVQQYVHAHVRKSLARSYISPAVAADIEAKIMDVSGGNFLHARLAWEQFSSGIRSWSREQIRDGLLRLDRASHDLVAVYCRLLRGIPSSHRSKAKAAFAILRVSRQKLSSRQLAFFATLYSHQQEQEQKQKQDRKHEQPVLRELELQSADFDNYLSVACGYIVRKAKDGTVDFSHVSAKDLLTASTDGIGPDDQRTLAAFRMSDADADVLAQTLCQAVLEIEARRPDSAWHNLLADVTLAQEKLMTSFGYFPSSEQIRQRLAVGASLIRKASKTPCFLYALRHWVAHYEAAAATITPSRSTDRALAAFLSTPAAASCHSLWLAIRADASSTSHLSTYLEVHTDTDGTSTSAALFRTMARGDCPGIVRALLAAGADVNAPGDSQSYITPLSWAIICQRRESFQLLLRNENISVNYGRPQALKPMHYAARCCDDVFFVQALAANPYTNINVMGGAIGSPLHQAMHSQNVAAVNVLLNHPYIAIDTKNKARVTPYAMAYENGIWQSVLERMIGMASGTVLTDTTASGTSPFLTAGSHGWTRIEEAILRAYPEQILLADPKTHMNALATYAFYGRHEKLIWILDRLPSGLNMRRDNDRYDLLHLCAHQNWKDVVVRLQTEHHLTSLSCDHNGRTLLHWAMEHNWDADALRLDDYSAAQLDAQDRDGLTAVHLAVMNRNMAALELFVSSGASYMLRAKNGMSPVHLAADQGYRSAIEFFIELPEREFGRTNTGAGLLHLLALWSDGATVSRFIRFKRARLDIVDKQRRTPLHYAAMVNNVSAAEELVALGDGDGDGDGDGAKKCAQLESRDSSGMTPLLEAIRSGSIETAEQLLEAGANAGAVDAFGQTCLHLSFRYGHDGLVSYFLALDLSVHSVDRFGMTPLHRACSTGKVEHIRELRRRGAFWNPKNIYGRSPIDLAVEFGRLAAVAAMIVWLQEWGTAQKQKWLKNALVLACELELKDIDDLLVRAGVQVDRSKIKIRRLYMPGAKPEPGRWPLVIPQPTYRERRRRK